MDSILAATAALVLHSMRTEGLARKQPLQQAHWLAPLHRDWAEMSMGLPSCGLRIGNPLRRSARGNNFGVVSGGASARLTPAVRFLCPVAGAKPPGSEVGGE